MSHHTGPCTGFRELGLEGFTDRGVSRGGGFKGDLAGMLAIQGRKGDARYHRGFSVVGPSSLFYDMVLYYYYAV